MNEPQIAVVKADLDNPDHGQAVIELLEHYPEGLGPQFVEETRQAVISGLREHPTARVFLAFQNESPVGLAVCFVGFSTFRAKPLLNIHDLVVHRDCRGMGIGSLLLEAVEQAARDEGCCRLTLEVYVHNHGARKLYANFGFERAEFDSSAQAFMTKEF